ncbi:MAG: AraC family transcriptional regulator [Steroidobacteraceae bacterium]
MRPGPARRLPLRELARAALHSHKDMSAAPLTRLPALLFEFGVEPGEVLGRVGVESATLVEPGSRVAFDQVGQLLVACVEATGCPHFGLLLGQRAGASAPGVPAALLDHAESVGDALRAMVLHLHVHDRGAVLSLTPVERDQVRLAYLIFHSGTPGAVQMTDAALAIMTAVLRQLCGAKWRPTEVLLPRRRPAQVAPYRAHFQAPMRFDSPFAALVFPASDLSRRLPGAHSENRSRVERMIADIERTQPATATEQVVRVLARMVMAGPPSGPEVAAALGISQRRLHERLAAEGTRYSSLLADVRCEIARQLLEGTRMPAGEIATALHYGSPGAFSRAFKAWTGVSPRKLRAEIRPDCHRSPTPTQRHIDHRQTSSESPGTLT